MSHLHDNAEKLIRLATWHPDTPLHVVTQFDTLAYSVLGDIAAQERWMHDVIRNLYVMADWESGAGPFDEPTAAERARKLLEQVGITGPINTIEESNG